MTRVHAFGDDALGDLDAVGLVSRIQDRGLSVPEVVEAAIARVERVNPQLNAVAHAAFDRARDEARSPRVVLRGRPDVPQGQRRRRADADPAGQRRVRRAVPSRDGDLARMFLATGPVPLGKTRLSEFGFSASAEHPRLGAVRSPWDTDHTAGASSAGSGPGGRGRRTLAHANDGGGSIRIPAAVNGLVGLKPTRDRLAQDKLRDMPVRIVSDGVLTRSVRDTAAFFREAEQVYRALSLPPVGDVTRPGRARLRVAVATAGVRTAASPEVAELTLKTAALLEELGHRVEQVDPPRPPRCRTTSCSTGRCSRCSWCAPAAATAAAGTRRGSTTSPWAWPGTPAATCTGCRARSAGCARSLASARFYREHDILLTPTLATETPRVGHLDPTQDYDTIMGRLLEWVAFTPLQNVTGDPAISLPLATTAAPAPGDDARRRVRPRVHLLSVAYERGGRPWRRIQD